MNYLFETKHFFLRERKPQDAEHLSGSFPEGNPIRCGLKQDSGHSKNTPHALTIEFCPTGALAGEVVIRAAADSPGNAEALCCLRGEFCRKRFEEEIVDAVKVLL